jgi:hypothetical protein
MPNSEIANDIQEWTKNSIRKLYILEDDWLWANIKLVGISLESAKIRCKVVKQQISDYVWNLTFYLDSVIVSVLSIDTLTLTATVNNADGFTSKGDI